MQAKIYLDEFDSIRGSSIGLTVIEPDGADGAGGVVFPVEPQARLRICDEITEGLEQVRRAAYRELQTS